MGVLSKFEQRLGDVVEGSFSRLFRSRVEPVELAVALKKEADSNRSVFASQTRVPNRYEIDLGPSDYERLAPYRFTLADELAEMVREHASEQRYAFVGPVEVTLVRAEDLRTGAYRVGSRVEESERAGSMPPAAATQAPPAPLPPASLPAAPLSPEPPPVRVPLPAPTAVIPEGATEAIPRPAVSPAYGRLELPSGEHVSVRRRPVVIGRGHEADVRIADASVSRRHAEVRYDGERVLVEDLGSTNGTSVNGERIARATLVPGDRVTLGAAIVIFRAADD